MKIRKRIAAFIVGVLTVSLLSACKASGEKRYEASFLELFDTASVVVGYAKNEYDFTKYSQKVYDELKMYNELFDIYNDYDGINNIKTINDNAGIKPVKVDKKIIDLLSFSREMFEKTDGKVNIAFGKEGLKDGMISVGGNVRTFGEKYDEKGKQVPWIVGIQNPHISSDKKSLYDLKLSGYSLVTSGVYERYYIVDGKQYHHIIDPQTLMPAAHFTSVSIVCKNSGMADALSTAVFNTSYKEGSKMIEGMKDVEALWVFPDGTMKYSGGFEKWCDL